MSTNNSNIMRHISPSPQSMRYKAAGQNGCVVWMTGLSASGKSTIAGKLEKMLLSNGMNAYVLDGDNIRHGLCKGLGFSDADRDENIRRIAECAALMAAAGIIVIVSAISPFEKTRRLAKDIISKHGIFLEVYVKAGIKTCMERDPKGLYKKALNGGIDNFTGISSVYEAPIHADIVADTEKKPAVYWAKHIYGYIAGIQNDYLTMAKRLINISLAAGKKIMEIYQTDFDVEYKKDDSPLTIADKKANSYIVKKLRNYYPNYPVLSEEGKHDAKRLESEYCFIVDPLDGTKEFIKKNGEFTINIGLSYRGKAIFGVIYAPVINKLFYSAPGYGSFYMEMRCDETVRVKGDICDKKHGIKVSENTGSLTVMVSRSHADDKLKNLLEQNKERIHKTVQSGSSLKGCLVACGEADVYYRTGNTNEWDTAAMQAIVEGAGGVFLQGDGSDLRYNRKNTVNDKGFYILNKPENILH